MIKWGPTAKAALVLTLAQLMYGGNLVAGRIMAQRINPFVLAALRGWVGMVVLSFFAFWQIRKVPRPKWRDMGLLALVGSMGITLAYLTYLIGLKNSTATNAAIITAALPAATNALLIVGWKVKPSRLEVIGIGTSFLGLLFVFTQGSITELLRFRMSYGELVLCGNVLVSALFSIFGQEAMKRFSPLVVTFYASFWGTLFLSPFGVWNVSRVNWNIGWSGWLLILYMGGVITGLANLFNLYGIKLIGSGRAAIYGNMSPVFGILLSGVILGERLAWYHWVGFTLVMTGVVCGVSQTNLIHKPQTKAKTSKL
ncbi:DMT family transporter [Acididesulfobacillus acetoxydans]|nr:DMT family transporter [Acididesulfobacillus acetoxydans]